MSTAISEPIRLDCSQSLTVKGYSGIYGLLTFALKLTSILHYAAPRKTTAGIPESELMAQSRFMLRRADGCFTLGTKGFTVFFGGSLIWVELRKLILRHPRKPGGYSGLRVVLYCLRSILDYGLSDGWYVIRVRGGTMLGALTRICTPSPSEVRASFWRWFPV